MAISLRGKRLTSSEQKQHVLKITGWTSEKYNKEYDKLRNRVRNYESATGAERGSINVADLLARNAVGNVYAARAGETYQPTALYRAVMTAPSSSTTAIEQRAKKERLTDEQISAAKGRRAKKINERAKEIYTGRLIGGVWTGGQFSKMLNKSSIAGEALAGLYTGGRDPTAEDIRFVLSQIGAQINVIKEMQAKANKELPWWLQGEPESP